MTAPARDHLADGLLDGCVIECPEQNGRFDLRTGEPVRKPATEPLTRYGCTVLDGRVVADLDGPTTSAAPTDATTDLESKETS